MAETSKILEGVFAVCKPPSLSSAQVIRDLQQHFAKSKTFAPLLADMHRRYEIEDRHQAKRRRRDPDSIFKIGHGGTLDPLATGVLIIAIGRGTKHLQNFLGCTKQYDTVVLFGKSTDTYDVMGKIVGEAPSTQITKDKVEGSLGQFRGKIKQVPPVYSALKINGMKAYEYARSGKELPRQLESRDMEVTECRLVEYLERGQHDFRWPVEEATEEEKVAMKKLMKSAEATSKPQNAALDPSISAGFDQIKDAAKTEPEAQLIDPKRPTETVQASSTTETEAVPTLRGAELPKSTSEGSVEQLVEQHPATLEPSAEQALTSTPDQPLPEKPDATTATAMASTATATIANAPALVPDPKSNTLAPEVKAALHTHAMPTLSSDPSPSPAARITLTVSSGFYVRSFAHDLGLTLNSHGIMAELTRSRQGDFVIPSLASSFPDLTPALTYADLEAGEEKWGPMITDVLEKWMLQHPLPGGLDEDGNVRIDDRDRDRDQNRNRYQKRHWGKGRGWKGRGRGGSSGSSSRH